MNTIPTPEPPATYATLDIGSNAVKLTVIRRDGQSLCEVQDIERVTRLAEGITPSGELHPRSIDRTAQAVADLMQESGVRPLDVDAIGTWALRRATNLSLLIERIGRFHPLRVRILSEEEEATSVYYAVREQLGNSSPLATLDFGGGSTDVAWGEGPFPRETISLPLGARRLRELLPTSDPPRRAELDAIRSHVRAVLLEHPIQLPTGVRLTLTGGAASAIATAARKLPPSEAGLVKEITLEMFDLLVQRLSQMTLPQLRDWLAPHHTERADVILHSALAMREALGVFGVDMARISLRGPGHGLALLRARGIPLLTEEALFTLPLSDFPPINRAGRNGEVLFAMIRPDGAIWMQRKEAYGAQVFRLPGGGIDDGESSLVAVMRELAEETSFTAGNPLPLGRLHYRAVDGGTITFFSDLYLVPCGDFEPLTLDEAEEVAEWRLFPPAEWPVLQQRLLEIDDHRHAWGVFRAAALSFLCSLNSRNAL